MGRFISIGRTERAALSLTAPPFVWKPRDVEPRFVKVGVSKPTPEPVLKAPLHVITPTTPEVMITTTSVPAPAPMSAPSPAPVFTVENLTAPTLPVADITVSTLPVTEPSTPASVSGGAMATLPPPAQVDNVSPRTPLSQNLLSVRRKLNLTPEEFARPIIEGGEGLINRLEAGFSRPSAEISNLICETWGICSDYLYRGLGPMFEKDDTDNPEKHTILLIRLLKTYLSVATFNKRGVQYWKGSLVDDLARLIDVRKLDGRNMSRIARLLFDYLDVDQFAEFLERMGR